MDLKIGGKFALVTGGANGIGKEIVVALAESGVKVAFTSRDKLKGEQLLIELLKISSGHKFIHIDISSENGPSIAFEELRNSNFFPDILVNNVGDTLNILDPECQISDWKKIYRLNLEVHIEMVNFAIPHMKAAGWGRIVNITAGAALENSGPVPYSTMKAAYTAYTRSMARVLAPTGIVMSAVLPGVVLTEGGHWDKVLKERPEHAEKYLEERTSLKRFGSPEEITPFVLLLCSPLASFAVGAIFPVEGGQARHYFAGNLESYA